MLLSRLGTVLLLLLSGISFACVYVLNLQGDANRDALSRLVAPIVQSVVDDPSLIAEEAKIPAAAVSEASRRAVFSREEERDGIIRRTINIGPGETLSSRLIAAGITRTEAAKSLDAMRGILNPRRLAAGQKVVILFRKDAAGQENYGGFEIHKDATQILTVARLTEDGFKGQLSTLVPQKHRFAMRATVQDGVYQSGLKAGIPAAVLNNMIRNYSYQVDFQREIKSGDRFEVLYEQATDEDGAGVGDPVLIYAALQVANKILPIYRVAMPGGTFAYFDATGQSIRKSLLRTPVEGAHLTSTFGMRVHPLLGYSRMHKGVDFGAPSGTPIFAAGAGLVEDAGFHSGYGRYIRIRHSGHLSTAYAHMSQFGRGITRGARINQGDIIGYVGASGMATGPHLHYEVLVDNTQVNPMNVSVAINEALSGRQLAAFQSWRAKIHGAFEQLMAEGAPQTGVRVAHNEADKSLPQ